MSVYEFLTTKTCIKKENHQASTDSWSDDVHGPSNVTANFNWLFFYFCNTAEWPREGTSNTVFPQPTEVNYNNCLTLQKNIGFSCEGYCFPPISVLGASRVWAEHFAQDERPAHITRLKFKPGPEHSTSSKTPEHLLLGHLPSDGKLTQGSISSTHQPNHEAVGIKTDCSHISSALPVSKFKTAKSYSDQEVKTSVSTIWSKTIHLV